MDIYLTSQRTGVRLRIPLLPDRLNVKTGASVVSFSIIKKGEVKIPRGSTLTGYSWTSVFPGDSMAGASFVFDWQKPSNIISMIEDWQANGDTISLLVTELSINVDVFIESFVYDYFGTGNASYTINLTKRIQLSVTTTPAPVIPPASTESQETAESTDNKKYGIVTGGSVNVRKGPSTKYKSYGTKHKGDKVEILDKSGNWYKIVYEKGEGGVAWMSASYIKVTSGSTSSTTSSSSSSSKKKKTSSGSTTSKESTGSKSTTYKAPSSVLINAAKAAVNSKIVSKVVKATSSVIKKITSIFKKK